MLATHATTPAVSDAASSTSAAPRSFDPLTIHRVSTIGFVGAHVSEADGRRKARRNAATPMTKAERLAQRKSSWSVPEPDDAAHPAWIQFVIEYMRKNQDHQVYVAVTAAGGGSRSMSIMPISDALALTFAKIADEGERWVLFEECFKSCIRLNAEGTAIVFGDFVARPIAFKSDRVAANMLVVQYFKFPAKASFTKSFALAHAAQEEQRTVSRVIITDLPVTLPCGHHVPTLFDSWPAMHSGRNYRFCIKCLDPVIDLFQLFELPKYTEDEWMAWIVDELDPVRLAAFADLRGLPWLSCEWVQVARMVGEMFGVKDPHSPQFASTLAVSTNARLEVRQTKDASSVFEWMREDVVSTVVWEEDGLILDGRFASYLFDWVEQHGRDTFIESRADLYWYLDQYCALATITPADQACNRLPNLPPRAGHTCTSASISAKYSPLQQTCAAVARLLHSEPSTPRSRRSRFSTSSSSSSSDSTASWLSEFSALVAGRLRSRTSSAHQLETIGQGHEVDKVEQGELAREVARVSIVEEGEQGE